jgi:autotransporter-associated beta strand protein
LDLNGTSQNVGALVGTGADGIIENSSGISSSIMIGNGGATGSFAGSISNTGTISVVKTGTGTQTLSGANTYTGTTTINGGILSIDSAGSTAARLAGTSGITINGSGTLLLSNSSGTTSTDRLKNSATVTLAGGTFNLGGKSEGAAGTTGVGALTLTSTSTLDFGPTGTNNLIQFAGIGTHTSGAILQITDWEGTPGQANGADELLFAGTASTFTSAYAQSEVSFDGATGYSVMQNTGYYEIYALSPVPEPATWLAGILSITAIAWSLRGRFSQRLLLELNAAVLPDIRAPLEAKKKLALFFHFAILAKNPHENPIASPWVRCGGRPENFCNYSRDPCRDNRKRFCSTAFR